MNAQTLKGFRDFLPEKALSRNQVIQTIKSVFELYGFDPLETPALEYAETLMGKYGEDADKLLYLFKDNGERNIGLRYDQTVPLARIITQYHNELVFPFKRYQIQPVYRAEKPQKGRFREFLQCDIDIVGSDSPLCEVEIIRAAAHALKAIGIDSVTVEINDRTLFDELKLSKKTIIVLDKLDKIGEDKVIELLKEDGHDDPKKLLDTLRIHEKSERLTQILSHLSDIKVVYNPLLARGLDYYTSTIFEIKIDNYIGGSIAGGGRYDNLIGHFTGKSLPAVGIAFGFDRIVEAMEELHLLKNKKTTTDVLVISLEKDTDDYSFSILKTLRENDIRSEMYLDDVKLEKKLKYADKKGIPQVIIVGSEEKNTNTVTLKTLATHTQQKVPVHELQTLLKDS
jgi:histidyl-tRNA synthetase